MDDILQKIIANKRPEIAAHKELLSFAELEKQIQSVPQRASFKQALITSPTGIIAEFKRRSPSRGWIFKDATVEDVIPLYSQFGASAVSVLTDHDFFGGTLNDLENAAGLTSTPLLRKEFIIDEYQILQAKKYGASAILLIAAAISKDENKRFAAFAKSLGLDVLLEIHNEKEAEYIHEQVDVVGINNRNLRTFVTDVDISFRLAELIPDEYVKISESGISQASTVKELRQAGFRGFLMGENFMKTPNPGKALENFIDQLLADKL